MKKEYTVIEVIQVTTIRKPTGGRFHIVDKIRNAWIKKRLNADDINVLNRQVFERELP